MSARTPWATGRKIGFAGLLGVVGGGIILWYIVTFTAVCRPSSIQNLSLLLLIVSLASPVALIWAAVKDKWLWALGLLPAILLLLSVLGTFEGC